MFAASRSCAVRRTHFDVSWARNSIYSPRAIATCERTPRTWISRRTTNRALRLIDERAHGDGSNHVGKRVAKSSKECKRPPRRRCDGLSRSRGLCRLPIWIHELLLLDTDPHVPPAVRQPVASTHCQDRSHSDPVLF